MNKYLLMCAAAAWATTAAGSAQAGSYSVHFVGADGTSYCDGEVGVSTASYAAGQHVYSHCSNSGNLETVGLISRGDKGIPGGKGRKAGHAAMSDTFFAHYEHSYSYALTYDLETPIAAGGKWDMWVSFGDSAVLENYGVLKAWQDARVPGKRAESSVAKLESALKARKQD